ncbi:hypothetical protein ACFE04_023385 [Oxalis oulophora]
MSKSWLDAQDGIATKKPSTYNGYLSVGLDPESMHYIEIKLARTFGYLAPKYSEHRDFNELVDAAVRVEQAINVKNETLERKRNAQSTLSKSKSSKRPFTRDWNNTNISGQQSQQRMPKRSFQASTALINKGNQTSCPPCAIYGKNHGGVCMQGM